MAIFHMQIKTVTRAQGRNALASAAYRAGESIRDERTGVVYDHRKRQDVLHKEILLPSGLERAGAALDWARDRSALWQAAERAERQRNSRVAREYMVALPAQLPAGERVALARAFSREIADRYNVAVDLAVHAPRPYGDPRNFHAHLLTTTREVTPEGLGAKTGLDMQGTVRAELGLPPSRQQFKALRERWAQLANEALGLAHVPERIDHRSLAEQGIDREPRPNLPVAAVAALRRGERSEVAERLFERYRERLALRQAAAERRSGQERAAARPLEERAGPEPQEAPGGAAQQAPPPVAGEQTPDPPPRDSEAHRQQAVRDWLAYRATQGRAVGAADERHASRQGAEDLRRQAIEAWRSLRAKEGESRRGQSTAGRDRDASPQSPLQQRSRDAGSDHSL
jgi:hypothetical protein